MTLIRNITTHRDLSGSEMAVIAAALRCYADECRGFSLLYEPKAEWRRIGQTARALAVEFQEAS